MTILVVLLECTGQTLAGQNLYPMSSLPAQVKETFRLNKHTQITGQGQKQVHKLLVCTNMVDSEMKSTVDHIQLCASFMKNYKNINKLREKPEIR